MTYLVLKDLTALAQDVIIAISILVKDMNSNQEVFKANAIRVLCRITDVFIESSLYFFFFGAFSDEFCRN
jgi:coatomer protein complex subunit gamma